MAIPLSIAASPFATGAPAPKQAYQASVLPLQLIPAERAAAILRRLYPRDRITVERNANAVIVIAPPSDVDAMRQVVAGIDIKNPTSSTVDAVQVHRIAPAAAADRLRGLFPGSSISPGPNHTVLVSAPQEQMTQIKSVISTLDAPAEAPSPRPPSVSDTVRVAQTSARSLARVISRSAPHTRVAVTGNDIVLTGPQDEIDHAKQLAVELDQPAASIRYTQVYRLHFVDAASVADLMRRSFKDITVEVDKDLNALTVFATYAQQHRIADAVAQLDANPMAAAGPPTGQAGTAANAGFAGGQDVEVVNLRAAIPGLNGAPSTSAADISQTLTQALQTVAPDLHVTVPANSTQLVLTGSQYSIQLAKRLIDQLDVTQPLVVLDTEILEVDETVAKNLGLQFTSPVVSSTFSEIPPAADINGVAPPLTNLQKFARTPISLGMQVNLLIQRGQARILADPRITVISGRTANIRAGDAISILTTTGGGAGTVATTQLQTFQTGVTLDITPVINSGNYISVTLHPTVNSLEGILNGVPQIATRDAQTTVGLAEDQTLIIGGLIQDTTNRTDSRIPILGDLPLIGKAFRNDTINSNRNELIVTVTPHIVHAGELGVSAGPALPSIPSPQALPTLPPGTRLPAASRETPAPAAATPVPYVPVNVPTPTPAAAPAPRPTPSAFASLNTFTYGQAPANNYRGQSDPAQIFYVQFAPTVLRNNAPVTLNAITGTNVKRLTLSYNHVATQIAQISAGVWQSSWNFNAGDAAPGPAVLTLTAYKTDGASATQAIPITIAAPAP